MGIQAIRAIVRNHGHKSEIRNGDSVWVCMVVVSREGQAMEEWTAATDKSKAWLMRWLGY
jgi:hypothetical protein